MLAEAARKRRPDGTRALYDELAAVDAVAFLKKSVLPSTADLIIAADVLVYMRELDDLFAAVEESLAPSGLFAFSTEIARSGEVAPPPEGPGWIERPSERIAHLESYLRRLADSCKLEILSLTETSIRSDQGKPIQGHVVVVQKS